MARVAGSISLVATGGVSLLLRMATVPLYLVWLGEEQYSLYLYLLFLTGFVSLTNLQFVEGAKLRLTEAFARGDHDGAWRVQQAFTSLALVTALVGLVVVVALAGVVPFPAGSSSQAQLMCVLFGFAYAANVMGESLHPVLYAQDKFQQLAVREFFVSTGGAVAGIVLVSIYRTPLALAGVAAFNGVVGTLMLWILTKRLYPEFRVRPRWIPEVNRDLLRIGLRGYLHRAMLTVSTTIDKILLPHALPLRQLSHYQVPGQVPITLQRVMDPIQNTLRPELTRKGMAGSADLAASTERFARIVLGIACCAILIPSSFGAPILAVWLPNGVAMPGGAWVMLALGGACTLELLHGVFNSMAYSVGKPHVLVPVAGLNALATAAFTAPLARQFGVVGIAVQNLCLFVVLLPLLLHQVRRYCAPEMSTVRLLRNVAGTLGVALAAVGAGWWLCGWLSAWGALACAPVLSLLCWAVLRWTGLTPHVRLPGPLRLLEFGRDAPNRLAA
ncbi:MAG: oligosaccharide flippase family protein [Fimbriimonadaceae bacterium]|nr:oligosaccharide flippase family protein [Chthonomonadaceae bacterium]MCO5295576.1 oligosaccharide flippase family protein [Fimbriimonadaceae bacterium]